MKQHLRINYLFCMALLSTITLFSNRHVPMQQDRFDFVSVDFILKKYPEIRYQQCFDTTYFEYPPFPLSILPGEQPWKGNFAPAFVLTIPYGKACSADGHVVIDNRYMLRELVTKCRQFYFFVNLVLWQTFGTSRRVPGRVIVLAKQHTDCYGHWLVEVLGRLAMIELLGIDYDWVYVSQDKKYMQETLQLWGIPHDKIIEPKGDFNFIQADELVVPSIPSVRAAIPGESFNQVNQLCLYCPKFVIDYLRNKFIPMALAHVNQNFSKRVYISRSDNQNGRGLINEADVFARFAQCGFEKYVLSNMSFLEQVALFNQAEIIVGPNGSGLTNVMFCNPDVTIVELFQARSDSTFYNIGQTLGLNYIPIKTCEFTGVWGHESTAMPIDIIDELISNVNL